MFDRVADIISGAFSTTNNILPGSNREMLDTDLCSDHTTVISHERMAEIRKAYDQCVIRLGEQSCLVLLFNDDFFWE